MSRLEDLPVEIQLHILSFLSVKDIAKIQRTSKRWYFIGEDSDVWRSLATTEGLLRWWPLSLRKAADLIRNSRFSWKRFYKTQSAKTRAWVGFEKLPKSVLGLVIGAEGVGKDTICQSGRQKCSQWLNFKSFLPKSALPASPYDVLGSRVSLSLDVSICEADSPNLVHRAAKSVAEWYPPSVLLLCFSLVDQLSFFLLVAHVIPKVIEPKYGNIPIFLVGLKKDLVEETPKEDVVSQKDIQEAVDKFSIVKYFELGYAKKSKNDFSENVIELFEMALRFGVNYELDRSSAAKFASLLEPLQYFEVAKPKPLTANFKISGGYVRVLKDYFNREDRNELRLYEGDLIEVLARDKDSMLAVGQLRGRVGTFSRTYTEDLIGFSNLSSFAPNRKRRKK